MNTKEQRALMVMFAVLAFGASAFLLYFNKLNHVSAPDASLGSNQASNDVASTTTMPTTWKTYSSTEKGFAFQYPAVMSLKEEQGQVVLNHNIAFENHGTCDMKGDEQTYPTLEDLNISLGLYQGNVAKVAKQVSPYLPSENFTKDSLKVSSGFIDEFQAGNLKGFAIYEGAEGCGQTTYYFPVTPTSTLVAQYQIPQQLSGVLSSNIEKEILAVPGAISREESNRILKKILESFSVTK